MSKIALSGNALGTGTFTIASPNSNSDRTLNLPDAGGTVVLDTATQTLTNKTIQNSPIQGGAITQATAVASTSGTSIDFTGIPSWVKRITVMLNGVSTNGSSNFLLQFGSGSIIASGYDSAASSFNNINASSGIGFLLTAGNLVVASSVSGAIVLNLFNPSTNTWVSSGNLANTTVVVSNGASHLSAGNRALSGALDRIRITTVNGTDTFDAGSINIMYEG